MYETTTWSIVVLILPLDVQAYDGDSPLNFRVRMRTLDMMFACLVFFDH